MFSRKLRFPERKGHKPYIIPTIYGVAFLFLIVDVFALGYFRDNAPFHAVGLTLITFGLVAMIHTNSNLVRLDVHVDRCDYTPAGGTSELHLTLINPSEQPCYNLMLAADKGFGAGSPATLPEVAGRTSYKLLLNCPKRGVYPLNRIKLFSRGIYGLFYTWRWEKVAAELIVYPEPKGLAPLPEGLDGAGLRSSENEDFVGHRRYNPGDSLKHVDWKAYARGRELLLKDFTQHAREALDLSWEQTQGGVEERLSQLTLWVLHMSREQRPYSLTLPRFRLDRNLGEGHDKAALRAIALFQEKA